jgi:DNA-binding NarL/FixJ family response regulator
LRILIIDNNRSFRQSLRDLFRKRFPQMEVETLQCPSGFRDLLPRALKIAPHIVFVDMHTFSDQIPGIVRAIKAHYPDRVLVLMCNSDIREYRQAAYEGGADYCLLKDESTFEGIAALVDHLRQGIDGRRQVGPDRDAGPGK